MTFPSPTPNAVAIPFEAFMWNINEGLLLFDPGGAFMYANPSAATLLGLAPEALATRTLTNFLETPGLALDNAKNTRRKFNALLQNTAALPRLSLTIRPAKPLTNTEAAPRELDLQFFPVNDADSRPLGLGLLMRDLTRERTSLRRKDELVNLVAHELRTPLTSIMCFADLLLARDMSPDQQRNMLETIAREAKRLAALLSGFLNLRRLEDGGPARHLGQFSLPELVTEILPSFNLDPTKYPLQLDFDPDLPPVRADREQIGQVLRNLLDNSVKYSPNGGRITLAAHFVGQQEAIYVTLTDTGLGLPADEIPRLFQRFYRVDRPDREGIIGSGLGLSIVQQIITTHGGRVWVESPGLEQGSTFGFMLPLINTPRH